MNPIHGRNDVKRILMPQETFLGCSHTTPDATRKLDRSWTPRGRPPNMRARAEMTDGEESSTQSGFRPVVVSSSSSIPAF